MPLLEARVPDDDWARLPAAGSPVRHLLAELGRTARYDEVEVQKGRTRVHVRR